MDIKQEIIDSIQVIVDAAIKKVCPTITFGIITSVGNKNKCTIKINNIDYKIAYYGKTAPDLNQKYPVFVPFGKMNLAFIITSGNGEGGTFDYNQLQNLPSINNVILSGNKTNTELNLSSIKYNTTAEWNSQPSLVSENNIIYVYTDYYDMEDGKKSIGVKIGDGNAYLIDLPFIDSGIAEIVEKHISDNVIHITNDERIAWNNKISSSCAFGTCTTAAGTAAKVVAISDDNWSLRVGSIIAVKFSNSNSASNVTLNVNDTGAKSIWYSQGVYTGNSNVVCGVANRHNFYIYDGTYWVWVHCGWNSDTLASAYCTTGASIAAKTASLSNYVLKDDSYTFISISNGNTAQSALTLNINGKGAKPIYINGIASSAANYTLPAGTYIIYYDGTNYQFRTDGKIPNLATVATSGSYNDLSNKPTIPSAITESTVSGWGFTKNTGTYSKPSDGIPKTDLSVAVQDSLEKANTALQSAPVTSVNGQTGNVTITNITGSAGSATNDGNGNNIASTYKPKSLGSKTFTAQDKDGTAIVGSANDAAGASFYFGKATPTDFKSQWEITYRIKVYCANNSDYQQSATVRLFGAGAVRAGYETTNDIYNTSYKAAFYHNLYSIKSAGFANGYGNLIGVGLNNSANPTNTSYPRTIEVEILDTKNCVFSFFDYALKYANVTGTGSTNFDGLTQWDFANNGHKPNDNYVDRIRLENGRVYAGTGGIMNYSLCCLDKDGKWQSLTTTSGTGNTKTINTSAKFKDEPVILYYHVNNTATNGNLVANTYSLYSVFPNLDLRYSTNTTTTAFTGNSPIYIECTFDSDGFWSPTTNCITQTLRNGYYYIYLGNTYSTVYQLSLFAEHPVYYCEGTNLTKKQMPIASTSTLGGVKVGDGLSIDTSGVLKVTSGGEAESVQWSGVKNTPTTLEGYGITDAPYIIKFTLNQTSVIASKTPSEMSALFTDNGYILAKLYNSTDGIYETLEKITCNLATITFSTIYQNTLGGGFTYKKVIGNIANNTWTYEIS